MHILDPSIGKEICFRYHKKDESEKKKTEGKRMMQRRASARMGRKVLEHVHTKESKIMANRIKPAKTISSLS